MSLEVDSIRVSFAGRAVLSDVCLRCEPGEIIGLFGLNGSGKTTFFDVVFGARRAEGAFVRIDGRPVLGRAFATRKIAYLSQCNFIPDRLRVNSLPGKYGMDAEAFFADDLLKTMRNRKVSQLSGGELRYLEICLILQMDVRYVLLDEPFNGLSPLNVERVQENILRASRTKGIVLADHNYREVLRLATRSVFLSDGIMREVKDPEELAFYYGAQGE